jgi:hypothetical protein
VTLLLITSVTLLAAHAMLTWLYVSAINRGLNVVTTNQVETVRALLAVEGQQAASNVRLDANLKAMRDDLHALNEKASIAAGVTPPEKGSSQQ